jgi:hypothetical protein
VEPTLRSQISPLRDASHRFGRNDIWMALARAQFVMPSAAEGTD